MQDLISVVVPIYNVEKYLIRCVDSIIGQTYKNLEIILVDDGSTDNSGNIADAYKNIDCRVNVIHKKNGGISSARNIGIELSKGKYISFIDSDDCLSELFYEKLYQSITQFDADVAFCNYTSFHEKPVVSRENKKPVDVVYETKIEIMSNFFNENCGISVIAWNKLYKREMFAEIRYPEGLLYEDEATTYRVLYNCKKVVYHRESLYFYYQRENSITKSILTEKNVLVVNRLAEIVDFYEEHSEYELKKKAAQRLLKNCSIYLFRAKKEANIPFWGKPKEGVPKEFDELYRYYLGKFKLRHYKILFTIYGILKNV